METSKSGIFNLWFYSIDPVAPRVGMESTFHEPLQTLSIKLKFAEVRQRIAARYDDWLIFGETVTIIKYTNSLLYVKMLYLP